MAEQKMCLLYTTVLSEFLERQMRTFQNLSQAGVMTKELEGAYYEFLNAVTETFQEDPERFKLEKVFVRIPRNRWLQVCLDEFK